MKWADEDGVPVAVRGSNQQAQPNGEELLREMEGCRRGPTIYAPSGHEMAR